MANYKDNNVNIEDIIEPTKSGVPLISASEAPLYYDNGSLVFQGKPFSYIQDDNILKTYQDVYKDESSSVYFPLYRGCAPTIPSSQVTTIYSTTRGSSVTRYIRCGSDGNLYLSTSALIASGTKLFDNPKVIIVLAQGAGGAGGPGHSTAIPWNNVPGGGGGGGGCVTSIVPIMKDVTQSFTPNTTYLRLVAAGATLQSDDYEADGANGDSSYVAFYGSSETLVSGTGGFGGNRGNRATNAGAGAPGGSYTVNPPAIELNHCYGGSGGSGVRNTSGDDVHFTDVFSGLKTYYGPYATTINYIAYTGGTSAVNSGGGGGASPQSDGGDGSTTTSTDVPVTYWGGGGGGGGCAWNVSGTGHMGAGGGAGNIELYY